MTSLHQPAALTSACWRGPRTHARATTDFLEIKAADSLSGAGPPRQFAWLSTLHLLCRSHCWLLLSGQMPWHYVYSAKSRPFHCECMLTLQTESRHCCQHCPTVNCRPSGAHHVELIHQAENLAAIWWTAVMTPFYLINSQALCSRTSWLLREIDVYIRMLVISDFLLFLYCVVGFNSWHSFNHLWASRWHMILHNSFKRNLDAHKSTLWVSDAYWQE